jgi:hypothetical protein
MTNYEKLFQEQMKDPQFAKAYYDARLDRILKELLENLKEKISKNEPKEVLLKTIDSIKQQFV